MKALLRSEWIKFRTVRGWVVAMTLAAGVIVGLGLLPGQQGSCGRSGPDCVLPVGPDGERVTDRFTFVNSPLHGDGSITVRVTSLTGLLPPAADGGEPRPGPVPWAKAGIIIKDGTRQGSTYAAVMVTGGHGTRMQHDFVHDRAGRPGAATPSSPRWLRLTRTGATVTGAESADGVTWTTVDSVRLPGLPSVMRAGLFVTSPQYAEATREGFGLSGASGAPTQATATFDGVDARGFDPQWTTDSIGPPPAGGSAPVPVGGSALAGGVHTVTGSGDIAPAVAGATGIGATITQTLVGTFAGLIIVVVVATLFATAEYRRGLIRTTLAASPRRGRTLVAKAIVIGSVAFAGGLVAAAIVVTLGQPVLRANGVYVHPATTATEVRVVVGTAVLLGLAAVLAVALGALLRRGAAAVTAAVVAVVLPYLLAVSVLPVEAARWLLRVTPAAAFAVQQSTPEYPQVANLYTPALGYFPLAPWAGLAVLLAWVALALGCAMVRLRRRDV